VFDSGISASDLIEELKSEIDVASIIANATYVTWLNTLEQMLYSEIIQEQSALYSETIDTTVPIEIDLTSDIEGVDTPTFEDTITIYIDELQLMKATLDEARYLNNIYWKLGDAISFKTDKESGALSILYNIRPVLKTVDENDAIQDGNVMLPYEHIDLMRAKLRAEAYKIANEANNAANWINDYNALLEVFKEWVQSRK